MILIDVNNTKPKGFYWEMWDQMMTYRLVHRKKFNISRAIRCSAPGCRRLALIVDCHYPWHTEACRCKKHKDADWRFW